MIYLDWYKFAEMNYSWNLLLFAMLYRSRYY